jgi:hypothetical protein
MARQLVPTDAVILDELGYLPFPACGGASAVPPDQHPVNKRGG